MRRLDALGRDPGGARPGDLAFVRMIAKMLLERRGRWEPQLEIEGVGRAAFVLVANGDPYSYAGSVPLHVAPDARVRGRHRLRRADARARARRAAARRATSCAGKGQLEATDVLTGHDLDRIVVHCDRPLPLQSDGEDLGDVDEAVFEAKRDAVSVLV